jgi:hypothetical protein
MSVQGEYGHIFEEELRKLMNRHLRVHGASRADILHRCASEIGWDIEIFKDALKRQTITFEQLVRWMVSEAGREQLGWAMEGGLTADGKPLGAAFE